MARPFVPVDNTLKVEMRYTIFSQQCENVFYVDRGSQAILVAAAALAPILVGWFEDSIAPLVSVLVSLDSIKITDMSAGDGPAIVYSAGLPIPGEVLGDALPSNVTLAVKLNTSYRGKGTSGRQYVIGLPISAQSGNQIDPTFVTGFKQAYEALMAALTENDFALEVVSFFISKVLRTSGYKMLVDAITVNQDLDSQRRRLTGRGR